LKVTCAHLGGLSCGAGLAIGCDFPFDSSKFEVDRKPAATVAAPQSPVDLLVSVFTNEPTCAHEFEVNCAPKLADCADLEGCVELTRCMRQKADPVAEVTCSRELHTSIEQHWRYELLRHCFAQRYATCELGKNFDCVDHYGPAAPSDPIEIRQQLLFRDGAPGGPFDVHYCPDYTDCESPIASATMEEGAAYYDVQLQLAPLNYGAGQGWQGYRLIGGDQILASTTETSLPFWGPHVEITRLLSNLDIAVASQKYGGDAREAVYVQVVDCLSDPASGITFRASGSPTPSIWYSTDSGDAVPDPPTKATGAAGIYPLNLVVQTIEAWKDDRLVADWTGSRHSGKPMYLRLYPRMAQ
jgi:hypothetical protein